MNNSDNLINPQHTGNNIVTTPPLTGDWHHGNGVLVSGTIRIAVADFDTNPPPEFQDQMFDWMCQVLNKAIQEYRANQPDPFADEQLS